MVGRCSRVSRGAEVGAEGFLGGGGDRCPRGSRDSRVGGKEGLWGLSAF